MTIINNIDYKSMTKEQLKDELIFFNYAYHTHFNAIINDKQYDEIKKYYIDTYGDDLNYDLSLEIKLRYIRRIDDELNY